MSGQASVSFNFPGLALAWLTPMPNSQSKLFYYIEKNGCVDFTLSASHPYGLAINVFSKKSLARDHFTELESSHPDAKIKQTKNLKDFLIQAADDGYAGAILDSREPVYFCHDEAENMVIIKLCLNDDNEVKESLLTMNGQWVDYDGDRDIEFYLDRIAATGTWSSIWEKSLF